MKLRHGVGLCVAGALVAATPAEAQEPTPTPPAAPTPQPAAPPAATLKISVDKVTRGRVLAGDRWRVRGTVKPFVAGQEVVVRVYSRGRKVAARSVRVASAGSGGRFSVHFTRRSAGRVDDPRQPPRDGGTRHGRRQAGARHRPGAPRRARLPRARRAPSAGASGAPRLRRRPSRPLRRPDRAGGAGVPQAHRHVPRRRPATRSSADWPAARAPFGPLPRARAPRRGATSPGRSWR